MPNRAQTILTRFRRVIGPPSTEGPGATPDPMPRMTSDLLQAGGGRFPALTFNAVPVNPYKPMVTPVGFPSVRLPFNPNVPPSISPTMIIRLGSTPRPTGATVPLGAVGLRPGIIDGRIVQKARDMK